LGRTAAAPAAVLRDRAALEVDADRFARGAGVASPDGAPFSPAGDAALRVALLLDRAAARAFGLPGGSACCAAPSAGAGGTAGSGAAGSVIGSR